MNFRMNVDEWRLTLFLHARLPVLILLLVGALLGAQELRAHPLAPSLLELTEAPGGKVEVRWKVPALRVRGSDVQPQFPPACRELSPPTGTPEGEAIVLRWEIDCGPAGLAGEEVRARKEGTQALHEHHRATAVDCCHLALDRGVLVEEPHDLVPGLTEKNAAARERSGFRM